MKSVYTRALILIAALALLGAGLGTIVWGSDAAPSADDARIIWGD